MKAVFLVALSLTSIFVIGKDEKYPVKDIPLELMENVNVVLREDHMRYTILAKDKGVFYAHLVVTILNEKGNSYASQDLGYDKLTKILQFEGHVYDATGKQIKRLKNSEINDRAAFDGFSLFSDDRIKEADLTQTSYPYTVEFEYEIEYRFLYFIPGSVFGGQKRSTQNASYQLVFPPALAPHYKSINLDVLPKKEILPTGLHSITWHLNNLKPTIAEAYRGESDLPRIMAAPTAFEYDGYAGEMNSWENYGKWNLLLNKDRGSLPEATKQKIKNLTSSAKTLEDKTKLVYEYVQNKTRYVSIQLGIGGLQPFAATTVDEVGYGDCKALSNYTVALLKEIGVKSYYTIINAGSDAAEVKKDFPSHQFNHVIVSVPNGKDTLWLECTSQTNPFGYQGKFTSDRWALLITEEGGKLVRTPKLKTEQNTQTQKAEVTIDKTGNAKANVTTAYSGLQYENGSLHFWIAGQADEQRKWLEENIDIPNFELGAFSFKNVKDKIPTAIVNVELTLNRLASVSGKRIFITPNLMNRSTGLPPKNENRKNPIVLKSSYVDVDSITYFVPEEIYPEFVPPAVKIDSRFGEYESSTTFSQGKLLYVRRLKVKPGEFPASSYGEFVDFYKNLNKADNAKLVFLSKT
ncbi:MAG: DUF3857 domain-containing protein [Flammeovirgaceae bacterium]|jgi:hypothetical protein|nr:DUF3857 domain-containing protein [Flammeovirgaceae bacterium]